jgi:hypothetical protein
MKVKISSRSSLTLWAPSLPGAGACAGKALTLGKALAGLNAQSKGRRLGIYAPRPKPEGSSATAPPAAAPATVELMGRSIPVVRTRQGLRAADKGEAMSPESVRRYLDSKFGDSLAEVEKAMRELARSYPPAELHQKAFTLYESFRPAVPRAKGWGVAVELDLAAPPAVRRVGKHRSAWLRGFSRPYRQGHHRRGQKRRSRAIFRCARRPAHTSRSPV